MGDIFHQSVVYKADTRSRALTKFVLFVDDLNSVRTINNVVFWCSGLLFPECEMHRGAVDSSFQNVKCIVFMVL